jgi:UDP-N-acetylmuramyl pentapeptide phosphotransferase/UDP-N-acetylglucosamine-1-phosphate transferase
MTHWVLAMLPVALWGLSLWLARRFSLPESVFYIPDPPNDRSLHDRPVPRSGGVAILLAAGLGIIALHSLIGLSTPLLATLMAGFALGWLSFVEDRWGLPRRYRLVAQVGAALLVMGFGGLSLAPLAIPGGQLHLEPWLAWPLTLLYIVWMTNLYNFMDGMDGFAGGMAVFGFGTLAWLGWSGGALDFALTALAIGAAAGGFLVWNFPPARIFMGDSGSIFLGFLAGTLSLQGASQGLFPLWVALLVFSPFVVDATFTLLRRLVQGERIWLAHRGHIYQRLVRLGWGHRPVLLRAYGLMAVCAASAVQATRMAAAEQVWLLAMWAAIYGLIVLKTRWLEDRPAGSTGL